MLAELRRLTRRAPRGRRGRPGGDHPRQPFARIQRSQRKVAGPAIPLGDHLRQLQMARPALGGIGMLPGRGGKKRVRRAGALTVGYHHPSRECVLYCAGTGQARQLVPVEVAA